MGTIGRAEGTLRHATVIFGVRRSMGREDRSSVEQRRKTMSLTYGKAPKYSCASMEKMELNRIRQDGIGRLPSWNQMEASSIEQKEDGFRFEGLWRPKNGQGQWVWATIDLSPKSAAVVAAIRDDRVPQVNPDFINSAYGKVQLDRRQARELAQAVRADVARRRVKDDGATQVPLFHSIYPPSATKYDAFVKLLEKVAGKE
jgi:hypothetical protein